jgi:hypothetical protein
VHWLLKAVVEQCTFGCSTVSLMHFFRRAAQAQRSESAKHELCAFLRETAFCCGQIAFLKLCRLPEKKRGNQWQEHLTQQSRDGCRAAGPYVQHQLKIPPWTWIRQ